MGLEALKDMLPDYARDLKLNLGGLPNASPLSDQQFWGAVVATGTFSTDGATLTVSSWTLTGPCGPDSGTGTLTKQ